MALPLILVVEDDPDIGSSLVEVLEFLDFDAALITDGAAAYEAVLRHVPALVLLDIHLPGKSGLDVLDQIRDDRRLNQVKVAMVTADGFLKPQLLQRADAVLLKPYTIDDLSEMVSRLLG